MLSTLRNAFKVPELRKRILFTIIMVIIYRIGNHIPVPDINTQVLTEFTSKNGSLFGFYDLMLGGAFSKFSIFALGVFPYINASIIIQLLTIALPRLEQLSKEGEEGRKKIQEYTKYLALVMAIMQAWGQYVVIHNIGALKNTGYGTMFLIMLTLVAASTFLIWFGDQMTEKGIGNGVSILIFINIISRVPQTIYSIIMQYKGGSTTEVNIAGLIIIFLAVFLLVVVASLSERRIPVQYAGRMASNGRMFKGQSTHIPISLTSSAVIGIIFAGSVLGFPAAISQLWPNSHFFNVIKGGKFSPFNMDSWVFSLTSFVAIVFFTWFYTIVTLKPDEMAENMGKSSGFIPGIRPGAPTEKYLESVITRVSIIGGIFAGILALIPLIFKLMGFGNIQFGATSLLIIISVAIETLRQLESQLKMRHYQGFLK